MSDRGTPSGPIGLNHYLEWWVGVQLPTGEVREGTLVKARTNGYYKVGSYAFHQSQVRRIGSSMLPPTRMIVLKGGGRR